jgi:hypothetical protein
MHHVSLAPHRGATAASASEAHCQGMSSVDKITDTDLGYGGGVESYCHVHYVWQGGEHAVSQHRHSSEMPYEASQICIRLST